MKRTVIGAGLAAVVVLGPSVSAQAAEHHGHKTRAEKKAERVAEHRAKRQAARHPQSPSQGTTTTTVAGQRNTAGSSKTLGKASHTRGVVSCEVTAGRAGTAFTITNGCDTQQTVVITTQGQPGPWHRGLCAETHACRLLHTFTLTIQPGTRTWPVQTTGACYVQVDVKWNGKLLRSNHYVNECKPVVPPAHPRPKPPVQTHVTHRHGPKHNGQVEGHKKHPAALPRTGGVYTAGLEGALLFLYVGTGLRVLGRRQEDAS